MNSNILKIKEFPQKIIIEKETGLKFNTSNCLEHCPFCSSGKRNGGSSAFSHDPKKNIFTCFACDKGGNNIEFVKYYRNIDSKSAIKVIAKEYLMLPTQQPTNNFSDFDKIFYAIQNNNIDPATKYLSSRGINTHILPKNAYFYDSIKNAVCFVDSKGKLLNTRLINPINGCSKSLNKGPLKNSLYTQLYNSKDKTVFITEGVINSLSLYPKSTVSIFSTQNKISDINILKPYVDGKTVILAFDNDTAGNKCTEYYKELLSASGIVLEIRQLLLPEKKDINNLLETTALDKHLKVKKNYKFLYENLILKPIPKDSMDAMDDFSFFIKDGSYWTSSGSEKKRKDIRLSNFIMQILYVFPDGTNNAKRIFKIQNKHTTDLVQIHAQDLALQKFRAAIRSIGKNSFTGNGNYLELILEYSQESEIVANEITLLGWQPKYEIYAFSNGVIIPETKQFIPTDNFGVVGNGGNRFYLPALSQLNEESNAFVNEKKFIYQPGEITFQEWSKLMYQAFKINGAIGICYFISALFRDIVFENLGFFPYLFLFGDAGTGKTSYVELLLSMFGEPQLGISLEGDSTSKAIARKLGQIRNGLVYAKEYTNNIKPELVGLLKTAYEGVGYDRAQTTNDNKTHTSGVYSAIIIDGNEMPTIKSALYSRMIHIDFVGQRFTDEQSTAFSRLNDEKSYGFGHITRQLIELRPRIVSEFKAQYKSSYKKIKSQDLKNLQVMERLIKHLALIITPYQILKQYLDFPFTEEELYNQMINYTIEQSNVLANSSEVSVFWKSLEYGIRNGIVSTHNSHHYKISTKDNIIIIYISYSGLYPVYTEYCKKVNKTILDESSLQKLLTNQDYFIPPEKGGKSKTLKLGKKAVRVYSFNYEMIPIDLENTNKEITI